MVGWPRVEAEVVVRRVGILILLKSKDTGFCWWTRYGVRKEEEESRMILRFWALAVRRL